MSHPILHYIQSKIQQRKNENNFRSLKLTQGLVDFTSNDYLGLARDEKLKEAVLKELQALPTGSTGSRLLSGNSAYAEQLERFLANYHSAEDALLFNSGFDANYGLLSSLPYKGDTILFDELVHASMHDGIKKSKAAGISFSHNNVADLEMKLKAATGLKYVVVESLYSMDGDFAPLKEIAALCETYKAGLIVDEAHATGLYGPKGEGRVLSEGLADKCLARIHTFGKTIGGNGAVILCKQDLKSFLVNYCRPFIYSTALPFYSLAHIQCAYRFLDTTELQERRERLFSLVRLFRQVLTANEKKVLLLSEESPVQSIIISGNEKVKKFAEAIRNQGFDVRPILSPTVPRGKERIRICVHSFNTEQEVIKLAETICACEA
jgi:8-amino-7-oxononanoate synthase